jgi:acyl-CoA reductase-like NAD-dependent aldehyde dehydrogenase
MRQIFIDGAWVDARAGTTREVINPATLEPLGIVPECGGEDVARAVAAARAALPAWQGLPAAQRATLTGEIGRRIGERRRELAALLTRESGKPLCESLDCIDAVASIFGNCAARADPSSAGSGIGAVIVPFNYPLLVMAASIAPAIAAGGTIVCKPPPLNPLSSLSLVEVCAALPRGVINVVTGGADAGLALVEHPDVESVSFTGGKEAGRRIAAAAPRKRLELELSSLDAFIVCEDADLDAVVPGMVWARLMNAGQGASGQHIYVERPILGQIVERIHPCAGFLDVDDPLKPLTDLGPLISNEAARRVEDQVGRTLRAGARLILGGRRFRPSGLAGHFFQPTILTDVRPGGVPTREEILGPVLTITPVSDVTQAIQMIAEADANPWATIYARDTDAVLRALQPLAAGVFRINDAPIGGGSGPFGRLQHRGVRRGLAAAGGSELRKPKHIETAPVVEPKPWWFPYAHRTRSL